MNTKEDIKSISYVKTHTADVISQVNDTHRPIFVTQKGEAKAVVLDTETYERMKKSLGLLKLLAQGEKDVVKGKYNSQKDFFSVMDKKIIGSKNEK